MTKWADYCISAVRYNSSSKHIGLLKVHGDNGDSVSSPEIWLRNEIIPSIEEGKSFVTVTGSDNSWFREADVFILDVNGIKYIRTDQNQIAADNIGNLPEF